MDSGDDWNIVTIMRCTDPGAARRLRALLHRLGFEKAGSSISYEEIKLLLAKRIEVAPPPPEIDQPPDGHRVHAELEKVTIDGDLSERICKRCQGAKGKLIKKAAKGRWPSYCDVCKAEMAAEKENSNEAG